MEFRDLKKQYLLLKDKIDAAVGRVMTQACFIGGAPVAELEARLAKYVGCDYCISCANGTDALSLALAAFGVSAGDAVFLPDFTFFATGEVVSDCGAVPIFVDVDEKTFNLDAEKLERAILRIKAQGKLNLAGIIAVDLFGQPANYPEIRKIADKYGLFVIEDGAQGFGGTIGAARACSFGDISTTSFFPAKPLGCYGDGGAVFTNDEKAARLIRSLCVHGKGDSKYDNVRIGRNSRLDTLQAAILGVKLSAFEEYELGNINKCAKMYDKALAGIIDTPIVPQGFKSSWAQYTLVLKSRAQRDGLCAFLKEQGIPSMLYYPKPMHLQKAFEAVAGLSEELELSTRLCDTVLSLPMHPYLTQEDVVSVATAIKTYLEK